MYFNDIFSRFDEKLIFMTCREVRLLHKAHYFLLKTSVKFDIDWSQAVLFFKLIRPNNGMCCIDIYLL